jgi:hypothetical protein
MYTHNPPEQFSLVTRAESTCVERSFRALLGEARGSRCFGPWWRTGAPADGSRHGARFSLDPWTD